MRKSFLNSCISTLSGIYLALFAILGNKAYSILHIPFLIGIIAVAVFYRKIIIFLFSKLKNYVIKKFKKCSKVFKLRHSKKTDYETEKNIQKNKRIFQLFSLLITEKLVAVYPNVTWTFVSKNSLEVALYGGCCRISLTHAEENNFAEVNCDAEGRININLIKVNELPNKDIPFKFPQENINHSKFNLDEWFSTVGNEELTNIVIEMNSNGFNKLFINADGEVFTSISNDSRDSLIKKIENFPIKDYWASLINKFDDIGLKVKEENENLVVTW